MGNSTREGARAQGLEPISLSQLIHQHVRVAIETPLHEELRAALGTNPWERSHVRRGYRNGTKPRTLTGPTGPVVLTLPRATLFAGVKEWTSRIVPRYQRRMPEVNEAIVATYLAGGNTHSWRAATTPQNGTPFEERGVTGHRHVEGWIGRMADSLARRPRRGLRLPRWFCIACA
jgi:transposase-like protein